MVRSLALTDALGVTGDRLTVLSREMSDGLSREIAARQGRLVNIGHATPDQDAVFSAAALDGTKLDWLIIDNYSLDRRWHNAMRPHAGRILAIDDLADRPLASDIVIDMTLGRTAAAYEAIVPADCLALVGVNYALLRPDFARKRPAALARRGIYRPRTLLISLGFGDSADALSLAIDAAAAIRELERIVVVAEAGAVAGRHLRDARFEWRRHLDGPAMAAAMAEADVCIGAAGSSSWERCCLGLPTVLVVLADNQRAIAAALANAGVARVVEAGKMEDMRNTLQVLVADTDGRARMSQAAAALVDGRGAQRVAAAMRRLSASKR